MPRLPINFANTMIYKLCCNDVSITDLYVGATTNFKQRKGQHKRRCCNPNDKSHHLKVYQFIRENGGWNNWNMILVEQYPCENQLESDKRERYWLEILGGTLNMLIPSRTKKEWCQDNAVKIAEQKKEYNKDNAVKIAEQQKAYNKANAVKIAERKKAYEQANAVKIAEQKKEYNKDNAVKITEYYKEWYQENAVKIAEQQKVYRQANAVKIAEQRKEYNKANAVKIAEQKKANRLNKKLLN